MLHDGMLVSSVSEDMTLHQQPPPLLHNCVSGVVPYDVSMMPMFHGFCCDKSLVSGQVLDLQDHHKPDNTLLGAIHHHLSTTLGHLSLATKVAVPANTSTTTPITSSCCQMSMEKEFAMMDQKVCDDDFVFIANNEPNSSKDSMVSGQVLDLQDHKPDNNTLLGAHHHLSTTLGRLSLANKVAVPANSSSTPTTSRRCCQMSIEKEIAMMDEKVCDDDFVFIDNNEPNSSRDSLSAKTETDDDEIVLVVEKCEEKRTKVEAKSESKPQKRTRGVNSSHDSKENTAVHEPDYIHVRARSGQATDCDILAERARRPKISEKMRLLQDLVPGCSKIVGKVAMLDEIINYVQSLQRQVEFLSMKLATHNATLGFNVENFTAQEETAANFPAAPMSSVSGLSADLAKLWLDPGQQMTTNYEIEGPIYAPQNAVSVIMDSSCYGQIR